MRIKKLTAVAMTGMMVLGMGTSVCAAEPITQIGGTASQEVKAKYTATQEAQTVYSVDIAWGSMEYTYTIDSEGKWNPETHKFDEKSEAGSWSCSDGADAVKVTNHSNAAVKAEFSYAAESEYNGITGSFNGITGSFDGSTANLVTAEDTTPDEAPTGTVQLTLNGNLNKNVKTNTKIGTATVTLNAAN